MRAIKISALTIKQEGYTQATAFNLSQPNATLSDSILRHSMLPLIGSAKIADRVLRCWLFIYSMMAYYAIISDY